VSGAELDLFGKNTGSDEELDPDEIGYAFDRTIDALANHFHCTQDDVLLWSIRKYTYRTNYLKALSLSIKNF
jgi:hypothetical protein